MIAIHHASRSNPQESSLDTRLSRILTSGRTNAEVRLLCYLVLSGADALRQTEIAKVLGWSCNTLSAHLTHLAQAGLVTSKQQGRHIVSYAVHDERLVFQSDREQNK